MALNPYGQSQPGSGGSYQGESSQVSLTGQPKGPGAGGTIWKAADYLLEKELLKFALEHRQVFTDNEPANARLATDGTSRLTKSEMWKDCASYLNTVILDHIDKFGSYPTMITHGDASQKFRNLKKTYLQKKAKSRETGKNDELKAMRHYQAFSDLYSPIQIESIETMHYQSDDQDEIGPNVMAQMLLGSNATVLENLSRLGFPQLQQARIALEQTQTQSNLPSFSGSKSSTEEPQSPSKQIHIPTELQSQTVIHLLLKISQNLEEFKTQSSSTWSTVEEHMIRQNAILAQRNKILEEQRGIEEQRFELEKQKFEYELRQSESNNMSS